MDLSWIGWGLAVLLLVCFVGALVYAQSIRKAVSTTQQSAEAARQQIAVLEREAATRVQQAQAAAQRAEDEFRTKQKELTLQAQEERLRVRTEVETELKEQRTQIAAIEQRIVRKEESL